MSKLSRIQTIATDPRWWSFFLQRRVMKPSSREWIGRAVARTKPSSHKTLATDIRIVEDLTREGIHMLGPVLTKAQCAEIFDYFSSKLVHDPYNTNYERFSPLSEDRRQNTHLAHHDATDILKAPYLLDIANSPKIVDTLETIFGCKPTIGYMAAWWSYATGQAAEHAELFHRDVDDWAFIKFFVYLTDVSPKNGPHKYVKSSGNAEKLVKIGRFDDAEVVENFGSQSILTITDTAGSGFLENTFGIHKGQPVQEGRRLLFQVVYSINKLPYAPKRPVMKITDLDTPSLDPWTNRVYLKMGAS